MVRDLSQFLSPGMLGGLLFHVPRSRRRSKDPEKREQGQYQTEDATVHGAGGPALRERAKSRQATNRPPMMESRRPAGPQRVVVRAAEERYG